MKKTILILEDDENLNRGIAFTFEKDGYQAVSASSVKEGKQLLEQHKADLIILDLGLPDGNGMDFCKEIRTYSNVPIIMLTVCDLETDEVSGLLAGADDYITKPFSLSILRARVEALLRRTEAESRHIISSGQYRLDTDNCKFYRGEEEIFISVTEFKLLVFLMTNAGQVLSKEQILSALWDKSGNFVDENTLPVNISRLRAKLEGDPKNPKTIKTIHGIGYIWERRDLRMVLTFTFAIAFILSGLTILFSYLYVKRTFDSIDGVLDSVSARNPELSFEAAADSRLSKLTHKAVKIIQMNTMDISQSRQEKEIIQSFISDMSHQMKTPLSGVAMYTDLLLEGNLTDAERQEFLSRIKMGTEKLQWMMDSLIKMSRLEIGAIEMSPVPAGIKQTISDSISTVYGAAAKKNISIQTAYFEDIPLLHDRKWTSEAITNILENAIKYSSPDNKINISVEALPIYTKISITDYGIGITPDEWNSIFKRFYRGRNAKDVDGAGLGLYLAALIFQKQAGYILVDSKPGQHTTFSMFLQNCKD